MRAPIVVLAALSAAFAAGALAAEDAQACGGCFHPPSDNPDAITDHRMILSVSSLQTTLYDQVKYTGSPSSFAWVLPINGQVEIGLSSDAVFNALDQRGQTTILAPSPSCAPPPPNCAVPANAGGGTAADGGVTVTHDQVVGPYETVQLHSADPNALSDWLTSHGYDIPADVQPIIAAYVNEHFDFLAMKLVPGQGVDKMRPVRVTTSGASPVLPLRMVAAGTGAQVGIALTVVAEGRYEPMQPMFPMFRIADDDIVWDWQQNRSNYTTLRAQAEAASNNTAWELEASVENDQATLKQQVYTAAFVGVPDPSVDEYPPLTDADGGVTSTSQQQYDDDMGALFAGIPGPSFRLTRLRADLAHAALANDLVLQAAADQSEVPNVRRPTRTTGTPPCPSYDYCNTYGQDGGMPGFFPQPGGDGAFGPGTHGNDSESFSCRAASAPDLGGGVTLAGLAGLIGLAFVRVRRARRR